jgi:outer membrane biosynthesis protein TonB
MKRCPQCEFIYEDDQSLCDMDGILLVFDSQQLPKPNTNPHWRTRVVPALAAFVLATVLYLVYYVSTHQQPPPSRYAPAPTSSTETVAPSKAASAGEKPTDEEPAPVVPETKAKASVPEVKASPEEKTKNTKAPAAKVVKESKEKPKVKSTEKSQSSIRPKPEDSKISSLLKKTGRMLKKPFKL